MKGINVTKYLHGKQFQTLQMQNYWCATMRHEHTALRSLGEQILVSSNWGVEGEKEKEKKSKDSWSGIPFPLIICAGRSAQIALAKRGVLKCIHPQYILTLYEMPRRLTIPHIQGRKTKVMQAITFFLIQPTCHLLSFWRQVKSLQKSQQPEA